MEIVSSSYSDAISKSEKAQSLDFGTVTTDDEASKEMSDRSAKGVKEDASILSEDQNTFINMCRIELEQFISQSKDSLQVVDSNSYQTDLNNEINDIDTTHDTHKKIQLEELAITLYSAYFKYKGNASNKVVHRIRQKLGDAIAETGMVDEFCVYVINALVEMMKSNTSILEVSYSLYIILTTFGCYTDVSECLCQTIAANRTYLETCKRFLAQQGIWESINGINFVSRDDPGNDFLECFLSTLHNIASRDKLAGSMRDVGFTNELKSYLSNDKRDIWMQALAILAALVTEDECYIIQSNHMRIEELLGVLEYGLEEENLRYEGWSCREVAHTIRLLARSDANKRTLVEMGAYTVLVSLAKTEEKEEKMESIQSIWVLCFDKENKWEVVNSEELGIVDLLTDLQGHEDKDIAHASQNVMWTLRDALATSNVKRYRDLADRGTYLATGRHSYLQIKDSCSYARETNTRVLEAEERLLNKSGLEKRKHIMISYNQYSREILMKVKAEICRQGYTVWMDVDNMSGSTLEAMACAVEEAEIILICMSQLYKDNNNCRAEAEYAFNLKKKIIPLHMDLNYKPDGWLGIMIGTKLFFDFSGKYKFQDKMRDLLNEIDRMYPDSLLKVQPIKEEKQRAVVAVDAVDAAAPDGQQWSPTKYASDRRPKPVIACDMTREFIDTWHKTHMLKGCIPATICADELRMLVDMKHEAPEFFYKCLCKMYKIRNPVKMSKVIRALRELYE